MTIPNSAPAVDTLNDATADFMAALQDPRRWVIKRSVPIFKSHERKDPATGKLIQVDSIKLARIANNIQRTEREGGVPMRLTLGHTEPGKPETQQPPVAGYYRNARVQPFGPSGELAVVADEWLDPAYAPQRKNFPYRSSEYYDDTEQITGVALLTRDPFLDLGVVAYSRDGWNNSPLAARSTAIKGPTLYRNGTPRTGYQLVLKENPTQYATANQYPAPWGSNQSLGTPMNNSKYSNTRYQGPWPGPAYKKHNIGHTHASGGAIYADTPHQQLRMGAKPNSATMPGSRMGNSQSQLNQLDDDYDVRENTQPIRGGGSSGWKPAPQIGDVDYSRSRNARYSQQGNRMNGRGRAGRYADPGMPGAGAGMSNDPLQTAIAGLEQALQALEAMGQAGMGGPGSPPPGPFPAESGGMGPGGPGGGGGPPEEEDMTPNAGYSRYSNQPRRPQSRPQQYGERPMQPRGDRRYARYDRAGEPAPVPTTPRTGYAAPARTISGLPVGYAMEMEQVRYENRQLNEALKVLFYERDQADTEACASEIQRLAQAGYPVGEEEFQELKSKPKEHRALFLQRIMSKYQRVGMEAPPPGLSDPTPAGPPQDMNRPASREEMEAALKMAAKSNDPNAFSEALRYIRSGAAATPYAPVTPYGQPNYVPPGYGPPQPPMHEFAPGSDIEEQLNGMGNPFAR